MPNTDNKDPARAGTDATAAAQAFPVNMYETDGAVVVVAPLPGVMLDDVDVRVEGGTLSIRADQRTPAVKDYLLHEWNYGPYERQLSLPDGFGGGVQASFGNGQLAVRVLRGEGSPNGRVAVGLAS